MNTKIEMPDKLRLMFGQGPTQCETCTFRTMLRNDNDRLARELAEARELVEMYKEAKAAFPQYSERRNLEKQLAEARGQLESWQKLTLSAEVLRKKAETERDNAESDRRQAEADTLRALHERNEAREQRDRLTIKASVLLGALDKYWWFSCSGIKPFIEDLKDALTLHSASTSPSKADADPPPPCPVSSS